MIGLQESPIYTGQFAEKCWNDLFSLSSTTSDNVVKVLFTGSRSRSLLLDKMLISWVLMTQEVVKPSFKKCM